MLLRDNCISPDKILGSRNPPPPLTLPLCLPSRDIPRRANTRAAVREDALSRYLLSPGNYSPT